MKVIIVKMKIKTKISCNHLAGEERGAYLTVIVFSMLRGRKCSVSLGRDVVGWSATCDCGISWSYFKREYPFSLQMHLL